MRTQTRKKKTVPKNKKINDLITVVLLCDNPGYRMKSYGPISLIDIYSKKLIDLQIHAIKERFENFEIVICLGFDCEKVCKYIKSKYRDRIRIVENQLYNNTNSCESLRLCLNNINNDKILICDGNLLFTKNTLSHIDINKPNTLIEHTSNNTLEIGVNINQRNIAQFFSFGAKHTWCEMLFLTGSNIIESFRKILTNPNNKTRFVFEAINELISMNYEIKTIVNKSQLNKINNIKIYHNIKEVNK